MDTRIRMGELGGLIVSNGYDYDLVNDDVLQTTVIADGNIEVQKWLTNCRSSPMWRPSRLKRLSSLRNMRSGRKGALPGTVAGKVDRFGQCRRDGCRS